MNTLNNKTTEIISNRCVLGNKKIDATALISLIEKYLKNVPFNGKDTFLSNPMILNQSNLEEYSKLTTLLNKVLEAVVSNYFHDERIRKIYQLDNELEAILRLAESTPYKIGMYRPDLIIDKNGQQKICEIGCRYPINGWMLSYYMSLIVKELAPKTNPNWQSVSEQTTFISTLSEDLDSNKTLFYLHNFEEGTEVYDLFNELRKHGFSIADITPDKLELKNGVLVVEEEIATQFILEMDREGLKKIEPKILKALIESENCLNDVRSLILVHDKRILSVLYNQEIIGDYITKEEYDFLKRFLIPSYILESDQKRKMLISSTSNWILKKNSGGKGIGSYVKSDCTPKIWETVITNDWKNYMVQEYVAQEVFDLEHNNEKIQINIVGLLLCYNEKSFGPGIFRGSSESIINVYNGGYILPCVISNE